jgi:hypothetical protein
MDIVKQPTLVAARSTVRGTSKLNRVRAREIEPDLHCWGELREQLAARGAELQQAVLVASEAARRYDAVGDHLQGGVQWRKAHQDQIRLEELERAYALVDDLSRRDRLRRGRGAQETAARLTAA